MLFNEPDFVVDLEVGLFESSTVCGFRSTCSRHLEIVQGSGVSISDDFETSSSCRNIVRHNSKESRAGRGGPKRVRAKWRIPF